jgi:hypothetical protein
MFFQELEVIAREHPDLFRVVEQIDRQLSGVRSPALLRPADFSCALGAERNQVVSVFDLLAQMDVLLAVEMVECEGCYNLLPASAFRRSIQDEDQFECTGCGRVVPRRSKIILVYRFADHALTRINAKTMLFAPESRETFETDTSGEPLSGRAQDVLVAMSQLKAFDSDSRRSTAEIAARAMGADADANSLKPVISELATRQLIQTREGRGGGCWLIKTGRLRAEKLSRT